MNIEALMIALKLRARGSMITDLEMQSLDRNVWVVQATISKNIICSTDGQITRARVDRSGGGPMSVTERLY